MILSPGPELHINLSELEVRGQGSEVGGQNVHSEDGVVRGSHDPAPDGTVGRPATTKSPTSNSTLADAEREHILGALRESRWVLGGPNGAAARLAMKRTTLQSKMKKLGISRPS